MSTDKRARKKQARDERVAQQWAAYRRRRYIRIGGAAVALVALVGLALFAGGEDAEDEGRGENNPAAQPSPPEEESSAPPEEEVPVDVACGGEEPPQAAPKQYKKPEQVLVKGTDYSAVFNTSCGEIVVDLLEEETPKTVNNFVFLANEGYFNGLSFHRIEQNFVIQSGDPNGQNGTPPDGPGYEIPDELPKKPNQYKFGTLAMANSGPNTGGSQFFFIVHLPPDKPAGLQADYSIFGEASTDSEKALLEIARQPVKGGNDPVESVKPQSPVYINSIEIREG